MSEEVVKDPSEVTPDADGAPAGAPITDPEPGEKTDPKLLLKSLQDEREKKKLLEKQLADKEQELLEAREGTEGVSSAKVEKLQGQIDVLNETLSLRDIVDAQPLLKGHESEFNEFRKAYPGVDMAAAARLFISEKGLAPATRKGLEPNGGGPRVPLKEGLSAEDVEDLRKNDHRKYSKLVREGKIKL